jgi:glutamate racemase
MRLEACAPQPVAFVRHMKHSAKPIGIFDSGLGGLTVVRQLRRLLPREHLVYLGDTARVPYGNKSQKTIQRFSSEDTQFLLRHRVKLVVVACNTSTALALEHLQSKFDCPFIGVIRPGAEAAIQETRNGRIGVIGTSATIQSGAYEKQIRKLARVSRVFSKACPLFVPLVEEGCGNIQMTRCIIRHYLTPVLTHRIDTLILGCTHYPLLKSAIQQVVGRRIHLVDSAENCAAAVRQFLRENQMETSHRGTGRLELFVTDHPFSFSKSAKVFLGERVPMAKQV